VETIGYPPYRVVLLTPGDPTRLKLK
jgi:hypothetical protein